MTHDPIEAAAKIIYEAMPYDGMPRTIKPEWVPGGNSLRQDDARWAAQAAITAYKAAMLEQHEARYEEFSAWLDSLPTEPTEKLKKVMREIYIPWQEAHGTDKTPSPVNPGGKE